uniref:Flavin-containing monooxygenase n=1 Tax=Globodera rostochiensis TaxID=31243 RepID=A0A914I249_GLORO
MKVCIIGAGVSGLTAIKACLEEGINDVVCYEKTSQIGGLWNYRPNNVDCATVMASTVINTSKEMMAYSDFPPPCEFPNFMHHSYVQKYLQMYAHKFNLLQYIEFNTVVTKMTLNDKIWHVELSNGKSGKFDAAMLCTGHHCEPLIPEIPGLINFKGQVLHANQYRDYKGFEGKRVFILGIGNSALDIGVELAKIAKNVIISTRRGTWVFNRVIQNGLPYDVVYQSRFYQWMMSILPWTIANDFHEHRMQQRMDHDMYGLRPAHRFFQQHPAVNDSLANLLASGQITIANDISSIGEHSICVKDGREFGTDVLILCTGYTFGFPFIDPPELIPTKSQNDVDLYKYVFPPSNCVAKRLAVIGLVQPIGSVAPIAEMQARWAAAIFSARLELPDEAEMRVNIARTRATMRRQYFESSKHTLQVPFIPYMDELAELVGCMPKIKKILMDEPKLGLRIFFGPNVPYIYRISGPNKWNNAKLAINMLPERVKMPLKHGAIDKMPKRKCKGLVDSWFNYGITKCFALYFGVLFTVGLWLCARSDGCSSTMFITYNILISLISFTVWLFHFNVVWL